MVDMQRPLLFQLTAARRRLVRVHVCAWFPVPFQLTAARRRLAACLANINNVIGFQLTAARRRLDTKSSAKISLTGFNSQPPEGGWVLAPQMTAIQGMFQLTAARRRLVPPLKPLTGKACIALFR